MTPLEIHIKTYADLAAAERAKIAMDNIAGATKSGAVATDAGRDAAGRFTAGTKELAEAHGGLGGALKEVTHAVPGLGTAVTLLKNPYVELIAVLAAGLHELKGAESVFLKLTQHGADHTNIDQYTEAVERLKKFLGTDSENAAQVFTRAMQGNYRQLVLNGIEIDKSLDKHEQLESIMKQLADGGGRMAEARAKTLTGGFRDLKYDVEELFQSIGQLEKDTGILQNTMGLAASVVRTLTMLLPATKQEIEGLSEKFNENAFSAREDVEALDDEGEAMEGMGNKAAAAKEKIEAQTKAIDAQAKALEEKRVRESELVDQQTKVDIAAIRAQQAMDKPTPENKIKYDKQAADREAKGQNDLLALRSKNLDEDLKAEANKKSNLQSDKHATQIQADSAHEELARHQKEAGFGEGDFNYTERARALFRNKRDMENELEQLKSEYNTGTMAGDAMKKAGERILKLEKELEEMPNTIKALHILDEERQAAGKLKADAAKAAKDLADFEKGEAERVAKLKFDAAKLGLQITETQWKQMEAQAKLAADVEKNDHEARKKAAEAKVKSAEEAKKQTESGGGKSPQAEAAVAAARAELDRINTETGSAHPQPKPGPIRPLPIYERQTNDLPAGVTPQEEADRRAGRNRKVPASAQPPVAEKPAADYDEYLRRRAEKAEATSAAAITALTQTGMFSDTVLRTLQSTVTALAARKKELEDLSKRVENTR